MSGVGNNISTTTPVLGGVGQVVSSVGNIVTDTGGLVKPTGTQTGSGGLLASASLGGTVSSLTNTLNVSTSANANASASSSSSTTTTTSNPLGGLLGGLTLKK